MVNIPTYLFIYHLSLLQAAEVYHIVNNFLPDLLPTFNWYLSIYIYKIKVLSVNWSKSRHILVAHVSSKVMNENTLNKIPVCLSVCLSVCFRGFREKLFTSHLKTAAGIIMKFHIWIRYLLTYVFNYITFWYLDPKMGFGGAHKWKSSNNS